MIFYERVMRCSFDAIRMCSPRHARPRTPLCCHNRDKLYHHCLNGNQVLSTARTKASPSSLRVFMFNINLIHSSLLGVLTSSLHLVVNLPRIYFNGEHSLWRCTPISSDPFVSGNNNNNNNRKKRRTVHARKNCAKITKQKRTLQLTAAIDIVLESSREC